MTRFDAPQDDTRIVDFALIQPISGRAVLLDIEEIAASAKKKLAASAPEEGETFEFAKYRVRRLGNKATPDRVSAAVTVRYALHGKATSDDAADDAPGPEIAFAEVTVVAHYLLLDAIEGEFSSEALDLFAEINGVYNCWPYLREAIATMTGRIGLANAVLPIWRPPASLPPKGSAVAVELL